MQSQLAERDAKLIERDAELKRRALKIQQLTLELAHHRRIRFGCKSEIFTPEQRDLFADTCDEDGAAIVAELTQETTGTPRPHKRTGLNPLPPELPRIEHRHIRPQYACRTCETVTVAPVAPAIIDGGLASPGLHAWVLIQKFLDHLPLYRIEKISERHGVPIARSTLAQWVG